MMPPQRQTGRKQNSVMHLHALWYALCTCTLYARCMHFVRTSYAHCTHVACTSYAYCFYTLSMASHTHPPMTHSTPHQGDKYLSGAGPTERTQQARTSGYQQTQTVVQVSTFVGACVCMCMVYFGLARVCTPFHNMNAHHICAHHFPHMNAHHHRQHRHNHHPPSQQAQWHPYHVHPAWGEYTNKGPRAPLQLLVLLVPMQPHIH